MKTKEEILAKCYGRTEPWTEFLLEHNKEILVAMEQYASQQPTLSKESVKELQSSLYSLNIDKLSDEAETMEEAFAHGLYVFATEIYNLTPAVREDMKNEIRIILEQFQFKYEWYPKGESNYVMSRKFVSAIVNSLQSHQSATTVSERPNVNEDLLIELEVAFLEGAYEPSERGAGFTSTNEARQTAKEILNTWLKSTKQAVSEQPDVSDGEIKSHLTYFGEYIIKAIQEPVTYVELQAAVDVWLNTNVGKELLQSIQPARGEMEEAKQIIQNLKAYGMIHTVKGVSYTAGSHEEFIERANKWLSRLPPTPDEKGGEG